MHIDKIFEMTDNTIIEKFVKENGLATLITKSLDFPVGTHIPIDLEINENGDKVLWGHISKANKPQMVSVLYLFKFIEGCIL